jgi:hypothetical protein
MRESSAPCNDADRFGGVVVDVVAIKRYCATLRRENREKL